jgi:mannosylglycoprotein endo-beta-mannosidase
LLSLEQAKENDFLSLDQVNRKVLINTQLLDMLVDDELYWLKRSHENWLHKGDLNTDYFHRVANGRRRKNTILSLNNKNSVIEGDENMLKHATNYYNELFGPGIGNTFPLDPRLWKDNEKVNEEDNHILTQPFSEEEVKHALFQMEHNKAAGPDCIPIEFYQKCWGV